MTFEDNKNALGWQDSYSVDINSIDRDHQALLKLLSDFDAAIDDKASPEDLKKQFNEICAHTVEHFEFEEKIMRNIGFPGLHKHKLQHEGLLASAKSVAAEMESDPRSDVFASAVDFLNALILRHMIHSDREILKFIQRDEAKSDAARLAAASAK